MPLTLFTGCDGSSAELIVEIALTSAFSGFAIWDASTWDSGTWGPDEVWVDVSEWVRSVSTSRKFDRGLKSWAAGKIDVQLNNKDGRFSPDNLDPGAPYVSAGQTGIIPGRPIRHRMRWTDASGAVTTWPVFWGHIDPWEEGWVAWGPRTGDAYVDVSGSDVWAQLARAVGYEVAPVGAGDTYGQRLHRILDAAMFIGSRDIDVGLNTMQATTLEDDPLDEIDITCLSEGGVAWPGPDGTFIARDKYGLVEDVRSINVQAVFGDGGGSEVPWSQMSTAPVDTSTIINSATYQRVGGTAQQFVDLQSRALYGDFPDKTSGIDKLVCQTDAQAYDLAVWAVSVNKLPESRVTSLTIEPRCDPATLMPLAYGLTHRDLVQVIRRPPSTWLHTLTRDCHITGITHKIEKGNMSTTFEFSSAAMYRVYASSLWDTGTWGASDTDTTAARFFI